jgi:hypothetical protein
VIKNQRSMALVALHSLLFYGTAIDISRSAFRMERGAPAAAKHPIAPLDEFGE